MLLLSHSSEEEISGSTLYLNEVFWELMLRVSLNNEVVTLSFRILTVLKHLRLIYFSLGIEKLLNQSQRFDNKYSIMCSFVCFLACGH